jgi:predicted Zn-dependent peptidase
MKPVLKTLFNEIPLLTISSPSAITTTIYFYFSLGSRIETEDNNGICHFIEHILFKGTKHFPKNNDISKYLDGLGVTFNAFTNKHVTCYYFKFISNPDILTKVCNVAHDMFYNALFKESDLMKERNVIIEEYNAIQNNPVRKFDSLIEHIYFKNSSLSLDTAGTPTSLHKITRKHLLDFYKKYYNPSNLFIAIGGLLPDGFTNIISKFFVGPHRDEYHLPYSFTTTFISQFKSLEETTILKAEKSKNMEQDQIAIVFPTKGWFDERRITLDIISKLLGGNMSSRLFTIIRDKLGLVYSISSSLNHYQEGGFLSINLRTNPKNTQLCIDAINKIIKQIIKKGFTKQEFNKTLHNITQSTLMTTENISNLTYLYSYQKISINKIEPIDVLIQKYNDTTLRTVNLTAAEILAEKRVLVYTG